MAAKIEIPAGYQMTERNGLVLLYPTTPPIGNRLDPTDVVVAPDGEIKVPRWHPKDKDWQVFQLDYLSVPTLAAAIRQGDHVLSRCQAELKGAGNAIVLMKTAIAIYRNPDWYVYVENSHPQIKNLIVLSEWLDGSRRPDKVRAGEQITKVIIKRGRDKLGRYNPQVMATHLLAAIYRLEQQRIPSLYHITVEVAGRREAMLIARTENLRILKQIAATLNVMLQNPLFKKRAQPALLWYHQLERELEKVAVDTKGLWGAPYLQLGVEIRNKISDVNNHLRDRHQLIAAGLMRGLIKQINYCPQSLEALRRSAVALSRSVDWRQKKFATATRQLERLKQEIAALPMVLELIVHNLRVTVMQIEGLLKQSSWQSATAELDRLIARCEW